ncbi:NLR family CARD domain-containing protein 3-like [Tachysurus ichikawai]
MNSMFSILSERRFRWLGHVRRMDPGRIPKDLLYGKLAKGARLTGQQASAFTCSKCNRDCHSRIGLFSHSRRCR